MRRKGFKVEPRGCKKFNFKRKLRLVLDCFTVLDCFGNAWASCDFHTFTFNS